jgi:hypothetical protein
MDPAVAGIVGVLVGVGGSVFVHWLQDGPRRNLAEKRKQHLTTMLRNPKYPGHWRNLTTLSRVIGASPETTTALLIDIGTRGSEKDDGLWTLLEFHPLDELGR